MMHQDQIAALANLPVTVVRFSFDQWSKIEETRRRGVRFSLTFRHEQASVKPKSFAIISVAGGPNELFAGIIRSVQAVSTFDTRVLFDLVRPISYPETLDSILDSITNKRLQTSIQKTRQNTDTYFSVPPKLGEQIIRQLSQRNDNAAVLGLIAAHLNKPKYFQDARALQQDAVQVAMKAFGADIQASNLYLNGEETSLARVHLLEDAVVQHDARWIPGWQLDASTLTGHAVFTREAQRLHVFTANKLPLEQLLGVDLIYFNENRGALVMVQYKMFEQSGARHANPDGTSSPEWISRINPQFEDEMKRMQQFDHEVTEGGDYRLHSGAFFFKFVKRTASTQSPGLILSLGHVEKLRSDRSLTGPKGGLRMSTHVLDGHFLNGTAFVDLIRSGYIGTRGATTKHLCTIIESTLANGRAIVAAFQTAMDSKRIPAIPGTGRPSIK